MYQTFLDDATIVNPIVEAIRSQNLSAQSALHHVVREFADRFLKMGEPFSNYAPELIDLERRVQARLLGNELVTLSRLPRPVVIIADELAPMQALAIDREKVLAFATESGSTESHTAILARHLGIPAVTGLRGLPNFIGQNVRVIVDGLDGVVVVDPDKETTQRYAKLIRGLTRERQQAFRSGCRTRSRPRTASRSRFCATSTRPRAPATSRMPASRGSACSGRSSSTSGARLRPTRTPSRPHTESCSRRSDRVPS